MPVGSDLFNIVVTAGFLIFVLVLGYLIYSVYRSNRVKHELKRVKDLSIFQISIPRTQAPKQNEPPKDFRETIGVADQFFASLGHLYEGSFEKKLYGLQSQISLEIISLDGRLEFFCISPREIEAIVEKQINSFWPTAQIKKATIPNLFKARKGTMLACNFRLNKKFILPIRTYKYLDSDPLNSITNALSKMGPGSGAAIQIIVKPILDDWRKAAGIAAHKIQQGKSIVSETWYMKIFHFLFDLLGGIFHGGKSSQPKTVGPELKPQIQLTPMQEQTLKALNEKASKTGLATNVRIVVTAPEYQEALINLKNITTADRQFPSASGQKVYRKSESPPG